MNKEPETTLEQKFQEKIRSRSKELERRVKANQERKDGKPSEVMKDRIFEDLKKPSWRDPTEHGYNGVVATAKGATSKKQFEKNSEEWNGVKITIGMLRNISSNTKRRQDT